MANKKKEYYRPSPMTDGKRKIIQGLLQDTAMATKRSGSPQATAVWKSMFHRIENQPLNLK